MDVQDRVDALTGEWLSRHLGPVDVGASARIGEGFGLAGRCQRVEVVDHDGRHRVLVAKLGDATAIAAEAAFLRHVAPVVDVRTPRLLGADVDHGAGRGVLLLEAIEPAVQGDVLAGCRAPEGVKVVQALARLHASPLPGAAHDLLAARADGSGGFRRFVARPDRITTCIQRYGEAIGDRGRALLDDLPATAAAAHDALAAAQRRPTHGDAHLDNILFADGEPVLLDWDKAALAPPDVDLATFLVNGPGDAELAAGCRTLVAVYEAERRAAGDPPATGGGDRLRHALHRLLAGVVNWTARTPPPAPGSREDRLAQVTLARLVRLLHAIDPDKGHRPRT